MTERYLGDGVYAVWDEQAEMISLDLRGQDNSKIYLDSEVLRKLVQFWNDARDVQFSESKT